MGSVLAVRRKQTKMNKYSFAILGFLLVGILTYSIHAGLFKQSASAPKTANKIQVTTSFYPLYFFASQIAGDKADVKNITPSGSEPHDYEPTAQDIARIEKSSMLILNGGVEAWGDKIKSNLSGTNVKIIVAGDGLLSKQLTEAGQTAVDPHVWLDPTLAKKEVQKITDGYIAIDPTNTTYYQDNEKQLDTKLDDLDAKYKAGLQNCQNKDIITSHAAFAYLGAHYGLNQVAISGLSPDAEPSAQQLADVVNFAKAHNVKYIFFESLISPKLSETIATEVGAKTLVLDPIEGISDDDIAQGKNYLTVMEDNLKNLQTALQCSQ